MYKYESVIIINPSKKDEIQQTIEKFKNMIGDFSKKEVEVEDIGERKLAYEIKRNKLGYYALFKFYAKPENIMELERNYRIDDNILKFIVVKQEEREYSETEENEEEEM